MRMLKSGSVEAFGRLQHRLPSPRLPWKLVLSAAVATTVVASGAHVPFVAPALGLWLVIGLPAQLLYAKVDWAGADAPERLVYAVVTTLLLVIGAALAFNTVLPHLGIERPLARGPVLMTADLIALALLMWRPGRWRWRTTPAPSLGDALQWRDRLVLGAAAVLVVGAVAGATRLNNAAAGGVSLVTLVLAAAVLVLLLAWRNDLRPAVIVVAIYLLSLALLFLTSLRGWYVSGHDIQGEFLVFRIALHNERWDMNYFSGSAYYACLSITILPTVLWEVTGIADHYVYKVLFQLLFALCPVIVYLIARRFASTGLALLACIYFIGFPTYFNDMSFVNRQEIALLFLGVAVLIVTNTNMSVGRRRAWFGAFSIGIVLAHYSTTFMVIGALICAQGARAAAVVWRWSGHFIRARGGWLPSRGIERTPIVVGMANVAFLVVVAAMWTGPLTHTGGQTQLTFTKMVRSLINPDQGQSAQSSDVLYNLLSKGKPEDSSQKLAQYAHETVDATSAGRAVDAYPSLAAVRHYQAPAVANSNLPLTAAGRTLERAGVDVTSLNTVIRQGSAKVMQMFVGLGLIAVMLGYRRRLASTAEFLFLGLGSFAVLVSLVLLPQVSVDYGLLRAFQQVLIVLAPFLALGNVIFFRWLGPAAAWAASGVALLYFTHLTGTIPQLLGGYPPSLQLNNAGSYYDLYYARPEERTASSWLITGQKVPDDQIQTNPSTYLRLQTIIHKDPGPLNDIYPTLIRRDKYVLLGYMTMHNDESALFYQGDQITYRYPLKFLDSTKNLIYNNETVGVYGPRS
jgi:hypothetical protein